MAKKYPKVKYEIDLIQVMEKALASRPQAVRSALRGLMNETLFKKKFGENVIDRIAFRTEKKRIDKNNKNFKAPYSKMYQKSLEFKVYGKTPGKVNLKLTGEMLASMKLGKTSSRSIKIIMADNANNTKAHGHINGIKRRVNQNSKVVTRKGKRINPPTTKVKRDFLGLPEKDEIQIMRQTIREFNSESLKLLIDFEKTDLNLGVATTVIGTDEGPTDIEGNLDGA